MSEAPNPSDLSTQNSALGTGSASPTSTPQSPDTPITALVPPVSTEGEDVNPSKCMAIEPNLSTTLPEPQSGERVIAQGEALGEDRSVTLSPEGAAQSNNAASSACDIDDTLRNLLRSESALAATIATLNPTSPAFIPSLQTLATIQYHIAFKRADIAAKQNPRHLKDLAKFTSILQRDHARCAREAAATQRQQHQERMAQYRIEQEKLKLQREQEKTYNRIHKESHKALQKESNAIAERDMKAQAASTSSPSHSVTSPLPPPQPQHSAPSTQNSSPPSKPMENYPVCIPDPNAPDYDPVLDAEVTPCYG